MRIYISLDMEGMPGTWNWDQEKTDRVSVKKAYFEHTKTVLEAIIGSEQNKEIEEIVLADSHAECDNLSYDITAIDRRISLISGAPRPNYMMPAFSDKYDMVFFLGYHSGCGTLHGNMDHTYSNSKIHRLTINDMGMNEALINAAYAGTFGVPVTLISGDLALKKELSHLSKLPHTDFITTKEAIAKFSAINYSKLLVEDEVFEKVVKVLGESDHRRKVFRFNTPINLSIEFNSSSFADVAALTPYTKRIDGRTVNFSSDDYRLVFETIMAMTTLADTVSP